METNSTRALSPLRKRVTAYTTAPKATDDDRAMAFWKGDKYMRMMMANVANANNIIEQELQLGPDPQGRQWQRDHIQRGDVENWWTVGYFDGDK